MQFMLQHILEYHVMLSIERLHTFGSTYSQYLQEEDGSHAQMIANFFTLGGPVK